MSDEADVAQARMELEEDIRRKYLDTQYKEPTNSLICLNCNADISTLPNTRWCDIDCREDYLLREKHK